MAGGLVGPSVPSVRLSWISDNISKIWLTWFRWIFYPFRQLSTLWLHNLYLKTLFIIHRICLFWTKAFNQLYRAPEVAVKGTIYSLYSLFKPINNMSYLVIYWQRLLKNLLYFSILLFIYTLRFSVIDPLYSYILN